ncbi:MAG: site-specific integrase [Microthrixaceae bacterium]
MVDRSELTVVAEALERAAKSVSAHSLASYERRWRQWVGFAEHFDLNLLPADPVDVAAFVVARHRNSVSSATISANLSAIDWMHRQAGG